MDLFQFFMEVAGIFILLFSVWGELAGFFFSLCPTLSHKYQMGHPLSGAGNWGWLGRTRRRDCVLATDMGDCIVRPTWHAHGDTAKQTNSP